jgi:hypothetical protein
LSCRGKTYTGQISLSVETNEIVPPIEITSQYYKRKYAEKVLLKVTLVFFILPHALVKLLLLSLLSVDTHLRLTAYIINDIFYNKVYLAYKQRIPITKEVYVNGAISSKGVLFRQPEEKRYTLRERHFR